MSKQDPAAIRALDTFTAGGWETIQAMQQGTHARGRIDLSKPAKRAVTDADRALLAEHGETGLRARGLFGVLDRLGLPLTKPE